MATWSGRPLRLGIQLRRGTSRSGMSAGEAEVTVGLEWCVITTTNTRQSCERNDSYKNLLKFSDEAILRIFSA